MYAYMQCDFSTTKPILLKITENEEIDEIKNDKELKTQRSNTGQRLARR